MTSLFPREAPLFINTKKTLLPGYSLLRCKSSPDPLFVFYGRIAKQNNQPLAAGVFNLVLFTELLRPLAILDKGVNASNHAGPKTHRLGSPMGDILAALRIFSTI